MVFTKISMLSEIISGQSPQSCFYNLEKIGLPFYQGKKEFSEKYIDTPSVWTTQKTKVARKGDILMSVRAPVGPVNFATEKCCIGRGLAIIRPNEKIDKEYLFYFFINYQKYISGHGGAVFDSINKDEIGNIEIPLPTMEEQKKIAARLDAVSDLLAKQKQLLSEQDNLIQSTFYDMFGDPLKNNKGWKIEKLGNLFSVSSGGTPDTKNKEYWENGDISWIGSNLCQNVILTKNDGKFITQKGLENSSAKIISAGSVLIALVGATIGKTALLTFETTTNQNIAAIDVIKNENFSSYFIFYLIQALYQEFLNIGSGKFKMANLTFVRNLKIPIPPLELQEKFAAIIEQIESEKSKIKSAIAETQTLFNSMMSEYFEE